VELIEAFESSGIWSRYRCWIFISIFTVRRGSFDPESVTLSIWPIAIPFSRTAALSAMPAESSM